MTAVLLAKNAYAREAGHLVERRLVNRYLERDPANLVDGVMILPRPGLVEYTELGSGPIRGVFRQNGVLNNDWLIISGTELYRMTLDGFATLLGTILGTEPVEFASDGTNVFIAAGNLYLYTGSALTTVSVPDGYQIISCRYVNGYTLLQTDGSGRFYWIEPGGTTVDALNFATAERAPDAGVVIRLQGDFIVLQQQQGEEFWVATGDADAPFQRQSGIVSEKGCAFGAASVEIDNGRIWVTDESTTGRIVVRSGQGSPERISVNGIEERLRGANNVQAFAFTYDGHTFYVLCIIGVGTFAFDVSTQTWSEFASYEQDNWIPTSAAQAPGGPILFGSGLDGKLYTLDPDSGADAGQPMQRVVTGIIPVVGRREILNSISLTCSVGWSPSLDLEPQIEMRIARDGFTFGDPKVRSLGNRGEFSKRVRWERLGEIRPPQCVIEFQDSDAFPLRISYCRRDEAF